MNLEESIALYKSVGHRNANTFRWLRNVYTRIYLPCINPEFKEALARDKTKLVIFDVLMDDLADNYKLRNEKLLEEFSKIPWSADERKDIRNKYLEAGKKIWNDSITSIKTYPRFMEFEKIFYFDLKQLFLTMEYKLLANTLKLDNEIENKIFCQHSIMGIVYCDMDLMCSPKFDTKDIGNMRIIFYLAEKVAHLGNVLNTYPKEVEEQDFSSHIISLAIWKGRIKRNKLKEQDIAIIKELEHELYKEADECLKKIKEYENNIKSVDIRGFSDRVKGVFTEFINCKNYFGKITRPI